MTLCGTNPYVSAGCGTIFKIDPRTGVEQVIYSFKGCDTTGYCVDGQYPDPLIAVNGTLYGGTQFGGVDNTLNVGTVFELSRSGSSYKESVLYSFTGATDGESPDGGLLYVNGTLYGATQIGGPGIRAGGCNVYASKSPKWCGAIFALKLH